MSIILDGTNGETFPSWTTAARPTSPATGQTGFNTTLGILETYNGTTWLSSSIPAPATAGNVVFTADGTTWSSTPKLTSGTSVVPSGTDIPFTGIPSWVKRITVAAQGLNSTASVQIGTAGGLVTSGYSSYWGAILGNTSTVAGGSATSSFVTGSNATQGGVFTIINAGGNTWQGTFIGRASDRIVTAYGSYTLTGALTQLLVTTTSTSGLVNIIYE